MNNKNWYDEVKEDFIKNINDCTHYFRAVIDEDYKEIVGSDK